jgi:hypothetical protein
MTLVFGCAKSLLSSFSHQLSWKMKSATLLLALCLASVALLASASATSADRRTTPWHALEGIFSSTSSLLHPHSHLASPSE